MKILKMGIVGAGQIAKNFHIPNYLELQNVEITSICDVNISLAKETAKQFNIPSHYGSFKEMINNEHPDAVTVCVPNCWHTEITIFALENGCNVFCEKPPAITYSEALQMEETAKRCRKLLTYGFHFRHSEEVKKAKKLINAGEFGTIYSAKIQWLRRRGIPGWGSFTSKRIQGGGPLIDVGAHFLDVTLFLLNYPTVKYVCANSNSYLGKFAKNGHMGDWDRENIDIEDSLFGYIQFENGICLEVETAFAINIGKNEEKNIMLFGERLGASIFPLETYGENEQAVFNKKYDEKKEQNLHKKCIENYVGACLNKEPLLVEAWQGTYVQRIINALYESAQSQEPVIINK
jgi:predicted dehydrogenase